MTLQHSSASRISPPPLPEDTPWSWGMPLWTWYAANVIALYLLVLSVGLPALVVAASIDDGNFYGAGLVTTAALGSVGAVLATGSLNELRHSRRPSLLLAGGKRGPATLPRAPRATAKRVILFGTVVGALTAGAALFLLVPVLPLAIAVRAMTPGKPMPWHPKPTRPD